MHRLQNLGNVLEEPITSGYLIVDLPAVYISENIPASFRVSADRGRRLIVTARSETALAGIQLRKMGSIVLQKEEG